VNNNKVIHLYKKIDPVGNEAEAKLKEKHKNIFGDKIS
jgi:hypothetical protein